MPASSTRSLVAALIANFGIAVTKFVIGGLTNSTVMVSEGIHSLVDTGNSGLMMFGRRASRRGPDADHPFGYGMELYFWSFVVAMVVFGGGGGLSIYEGFHALREPRELTSPWPSLVVIGIAAVFEGGALMIGLREFRIYRRQYRYPRSLLEGIRASKNPAMFLTVLEDTAALVGLGIATAGLLLRWCTGVAAFDGIASMLIGVVLAVEALVLAIECRGLIIGEPARPALVETIERTVSAHAGDLVVRRVRTLQLGPESVLVFLDVQPSSVRDPAQLRDTIGRLLGELRRVTPGIRDVFVTAAR